MAHTRLGRLGGPRATVHMGREKREMAGKESSNSTKLRHYGAFVLIPPRSCLHVPAARLRVRDEDRCRGSNSERRERSTEESVV